MSSLLAVVVTAAGLVFALPAKASGNDFVFKIDPSLWNEGTNTTTLVLKFRGITNNQAFSIDWGKGDPAEIPSAAAASAGTFFQSYLRNVGVTTITVSNTDTNQKIGFGGQSSVNRGAHMITEVVSWPDWLNDTSGAFNGAENLTDVPSGLPSGITDMSYMFAGASSLNDADISDFDTSAVTNMSNMFRGASSFNQPLSYDGVGPAWDTSSVDDMSEMFRGASVFNSSLSGWDTTGVLDFSRMFQSASVFNQDISGFVTSRATDMSFMFASASAFNQDISAWDTSSVGSLQSTFQGASAFNQNLNSWSVTAVSNMSSLFENSAYAGSVNDWNTASLTSMTSMFKGSPFNGTFGANWDTSGVTNFDKVFQDATAFSQSLSNWDVAAATSMKNTFTNAQSFNNSGIQNWDVSSVLYFNETFKDAISFNLDLSAWDVTSAQSMESMFQGATSFVGTGLGSWTTSALTNLDSSFSGATSFNTNIDSWDVDQVTNMNSLFRDAAAFNQPLNSWVTSSVVSNNSSGPAGFQSVFEGATSFNRPLSNWDVSSATKTDFMFRDATSFNGDISDWDVSNFIDMNAMFLNASSFNSDITSWDVSNAVNFSGLFSGATDFNQDISSWDTGQVLLMGSMFKNATSFNRDLNDWDVSNVSLVSEAFNGATSFSYCLPDWNISRITAANRADVFINMKAGYDTGTNFDFANCSEVTFKFQDQSTTDKISYVQPAAGFTVPSPAVPTRSNFTSLGFFDSSTGGSSVSFPTGFSSDDTVFLQWATQPAVPTGLTSTAGYEKVTVSWTAPTDTGNQTITKYVVAYKTPGGAFTYVDASSTSKEITGLTNGQEYLFKVAAINNQVTDTTAYSDANFTSEISETPINAQPIFTLIDEVATNADIGSSTNQTYTATDDSGNLGGVTVSSSDTSVVGVSVTVTGMQFAIAYNWIKAGGATITVTVTDGDGLAVTDTLVASIPTAPGQVTSVSGTVGDQSVSLSWTAPSNDGFSSITGYKIESSADNATWTDVSADTGDANTTYSVTGLTNGESYFFRVSAINAIGTGLVSAVSAAVTPAVPAAPSPSPSTPSSGGSSSSSTTGLVVAGNQDIEVLEGAKSIELTGLNLDRAKEVLIGGKTVEIISKSESKMTLNTSKITSGTYELKIVTSSGEVTLSNQLIVESEVQIDTTQQSTKVNAGSFKGYVAIYALNHEGKRLSMKVGKDWRVVNSIPASANNLYRFVEQVGAGVDIAVRIYIDRVLLETIPLTTK